MHGFREKNIKPTDKISWRNTINNTTVLLTV
jgi:hypothetical protein